MAEAAFRDPRLDVRSAVGLIERVILGVPRGVIGVRGSPDEEEGSQDEKPYPGSHAKVHEDSWAIPSESNTAERICSLLC
jgi:hypothetical protein